VTVTGEQLPRGHGVVNRPGLVAAAVTSLVGLGSAGVAWVTAGPLAAASALIALVVVLGFFGSGSLPLVLAQRGDLPFRAGLGLLLLTYALRLLLVLVVLAVVSRLDGLHAGALGVTLILCALVWSGARLAAVVVASRGL
jgi:ATP synthase protein I